MKLVGIRIRCSGEEYVRRIPEAFATLKSRLHEIGEPVEPSRQIGAYVAGDYSDEEDGYWACVEVNAVGKVPEGMVALTVPAQKYAAVPHRGSAEEVGNTYENLHGWIEKQGLVRNPRAWHLEISNWGGADLELFDTLEEKTF
ncbi:GyrI-like domain-containing protein [Cohnella sp. CBP 2801]|uniref:GyrI-like domain-containing protein n=2 Tax=Cohnella zeiphila TaxID=2761120 RepID=A0A7X0SS59_9BACL|nr:GyrI-like domain-containing protein [Cohnella zeiphila]